MIILLTQFATEGSIDIVTYSKYYVHACTHVCMCAVYRTPFHVQNLIHTVRLKTAYVMTLCILYLIPLIFV